MVDSFPHIVIIGAGFGGLRAARALAKAPVRITLIDRNNYHLFQPLLYQVATAGLSLDEIAYPIRGIFHKQTNLDFRMAEVTTIDFEQKRVHTTEDSVLYDYLIIATGNETNYFGNKLLEQHSFSLKDLADAEKIRNHILKQFEQAALETNENLRKQYLRFVVVGAGPTGVELAGALSELIRLVLRKDFPRLNMDEVEILLLEAAEKVLTHLDPQLSASAEAALLKKGVHLKLGQLVENYDGTTITLSNTETITTNTVIWAAGVKVSKLVEQLPVEHAGLGRARVTPTLQLPKAKEVFLIGDAAYFEDQNGIPLPMVAPVAMQQAEYAAKNILCLINGFTLQPFVYHDLGSMATIGRNQAVAQLGKFRFQGFIAWIIWLFVHLMQLVGFRNRLIVLFNWAWEYLSYERAIRLITETD